MLDSDGALFDDDGVDPCRTADYPELQIEAEAARDPLGSKGWSSTGKMESL